MSHHACQVHAKWIRLHKYIGDQDSYFTCYDEYLRGVREAKDE